MRKLWPPVLALIVVGITWELVRYLAALPPIILPSLKSVFESVFTIRDLPTHFGITAAEAIVGFIIGNIAAVLIAIAIIRWPNLENVVVPYAIALKTTPVVAFAPILLLWLHEGFMSKAVTAAAVCFFPTLINGVRGLRAVEQDYLDLFQSWKTNWVQTLMYLRLPSSLPYLFAAIKLSSSLAVVGAIVAEFVAADKGLGFLIVIFSRQSNTPEMFAAILISTILGIVWFIVIVIIERVMAKRYGFLVQKDEFF